MASALVLKAFSVAVVAGLDSGFGVVLVGLFLGALESLASFYIGSGWREAPGLVLLILALAVRPHRRVRQSRHPEGVSSDADACCSSTAPSSLASGRCWPRVPLAVTNTFALGLLTLLAIYGILLIGLDVTRGLPGPDQPGACGVPRAGCLCGGPCW